MAVVKSKRPSRRAVKYGLAKDLTCKLAYNGEAVYRRELEKTILAAVRAFKTRGVFLACMDPIGPLMKDMVSRELVTGIIEKFKEIERDGEIGQGWLHEEVPDGRAGKTVRR